MRSSSFRKNTGRISRTKHIWKRCACIKAVPVDLADWRRTHEDKNSRWHRAGCDADCGSQAVCHADKGYLLLQQAAAELADKLSQMAPIALLGIKKHLNLIAKGVEKTEEILEAVRISEASEDMKEGALAWKEKRKPNFSGQ